MNELKKVFKRKKIKYSHVSKETGMSESSIKRLMSGKDASLFKIEALCEVAKITFFDLVVLCKESKNENLLLSKKQDEFFAKKTHYFYMFHLLFEERLSVQEIKKRYKLTSKSISLYLKKLEELGLLERQVGDRITFPRKGSLLLPEFTKLGRHLIRNSIENLAKITEDLDGLKERTQNIKGSFHMGDYYLQKKTAESFQQRLSLLHQELDEISNREMRIYNKEQLVLYTGITTFLPIRLYCENIPNL